MTESKGRSGSRFGGGSSSSSTGGGYKGRGGSGGGGNGGGRGGSAGSAGGRGGRTFMKKKVCSFCINKMSEVDYKNINLLKKYLTEKGKIIPKRITGTCAKHQRILAQAIKRSRMAALLPFVAE